MVRKILSKLDSALEKFLGNKNKDNEYIWVGSGEDPFKKR